MIQLHFWLYSHHPFAADTEDFADNLAVFADANIHLRSDEENKMLITKSQINANNHHQTEENQLKELHEEFEEPIFSLPFSILPNGKSTTDNKITSSNYLSLHT